MKKNLLKRQNYNNDNGNDRKYSHLQYFFWLLSGCEINILKDCPTDYNRQAGIGFTIFMTTLLGFFSGSYAGWYFGENITTALLFGVLWAALIFSIDRSMVVTLKKDPTLKKQKFWAPLLSRAIMAMLIAFIISIPLELLIFQENIELHMEKYKLDQTFEVQQAAIRNESVIDKERILKRDSINASELKRELAQGVPQGDPIYNNLVEDFNTRNAQYQNLLSIHTKARADKVTAEVRIPIYYDITTDSYIKDKSSSEWQNYKKKEEKERMAKTAISSFDKVGLNNAKNARLKYLTDWISKKNIDKNETELRVKNQVNDISSSIRKSDAIKGDFEDKIKEKKGFVLRFMILEDLASSTKQISVKNQNGKVIEKTIPDEEGAAILFLLWLIRILFFTIEILPTIAKIATPLGAYDFAVYRKEREIEEDLNNRTEDYLMHQNKIRILENTSHLDQVTEKNRIENQLHLEMLMQIASAQNDVAKKQIDDFRRKHLEVN